MFAPRTFTLSDGIEIFFTDSGPPPNSADYTTMIILHGSAFNGHGFEKLHDHAFKLNLRTLIWNRRDYPRSTKYSDEELEDLNQGRKVFIDKLGRQLADFVKQFIQKENIPIATADRKAGGVAIMGWSMGAATAMSVFSDPSLLSTESYNLLKDYIIHLILDDSPHLCFGYEVPQKHKVYDPLTDPNCKTPEELYQNFGFWVSSFYEHPDPRSGKLEDMDIQSTRAGDPTIMKWTSEEFAKFYTQDAAVRSELRMYVPPMQPTLAEMTERVFYNEQLIGSFFPHLNVILITGTHSNWQCLWGLSETKRRYDTHVAQGKKARPICLHYIEGGNHFAHWEAPKILLQKAIEAMRA
ncbi:hypothetical protein VKT23_016728 [Stygiomarasmius scandens]|uniref:AB hydrolase-1 domain-containing protein n=1 Tax=Marasmiellus scandens TaxID=2682957 RepID=A0ABR1ITQ7_9AGAR